MARTSEPYRNVRVAKGVDFDDRLWPIHVAVVILAGCVAGIVVAASSFDDSRLLYNGWVRLGGLAVLVLLLLLGVRWLEGKLARRLQLCLVISLLAHLGVAFGLYEKQLFLATLPNQQPDELAAEQPEQGLLPTDYRWRPVEPLPRFQQAFEEPMEIPAHENTVAETIIEREDPRILPAADKPPAPLQPFEPPPGPALPQPRTERQPELALMPRPDASRPTQPADVPGDVAEPLAPAIGNAEATVEVGPVATPAEHVTPRGPIGNAAAVVALANDFPVTPGSGKASVAPVQAVRPAGRARTGDVPPAPAIRPMATPIQRSAAVAAAEGTGPEILMTPPAPAEAAAVAASPPTDDRADIAAEHPAVDAPPHRQAPGPRDRPHGDLPLALGLVGAAGAVSAPADMAVGPRQRPQLVERLAFSSVESHGGSPKKTSTAGSQRDLAEIIAQESLAAGTPDEAITDQPLAPSEKGVRTVFDPREHLQPFSAPKIVLTPFSTSPGLEIPGRRPSADHQLAYNIAGQRQIERTRGGASVDGSVSEPTQSYQHRDPGRRWRVAEAHGGGGTEKAVEAGLDFFARIQFPDGHWGLHQLPEGIKAADPALGQMQSDAAATGLALLTYLGAGYTHLDNQHRAVMGHAIGWLTANQKPSGELFAGGSKYARFYSHGIAAIALCEAYGMTQDPSLREPARKAAEFIVATQHPTRGGWRYELRPDTGRSAETDTSVSGWQLMALRSAQMAGLEVPAESFEKLDAWLDLAAAQNFPGRYVYNPFADRGRPEQLAGLKPSLAMTSEAMLMRMYLGRGRDDAQLIEGAEYLKGNLPQMGTPQQPLRDCYYWYYATQAMFQMQGDYWDAWNGRMRPLLVSTQVQQGELAGSWHPWQPVRDRWGAAGGRVYVTAIHLLMLEVYYRYLPLFQELSK